MNNIQEDPRYPVGKYETREYSDTLKEEWLSEIRFLPQALENAILNFDEHQLQTPYRDGGWTVHQLIHHVADSHMNAYIRFKLGVTEENPTIKPYDQDQWVLTADVKNLPINISLTILHAVHQRWHEFLKHFTSSEWERTVYHPEYKKEYTLWELLGMYAWHSRHHTAHVTKLRERMDW